MKHKDIQKLAEYYTSRYSGKIVVNDYWEEDDEAIGLSNLELTKLCYVTFGNKPDTYYLALEILNPSPGVPYEDAGDYNDLSKYELEMRILTFLKTIDEEA